MKIATYSWITAILILAASCHSNNFYKREVKRVEGLSEKELVSRFGSSSNPSTSTVADFVHSPEPWRSPTPQILSIYPTNTPENLKVEIKSLSWVQGRILLTIWLHQTGDEWNSFYAEEWNMDVIE